MATETVLGVFAHVDTTVRALEELRARGYHDVTVYTPPRSTSSYARRAPKKSNHDEPTLMKYVFILMLLVVGAAAGAWGGAIVVRWNDNMTQTARIVPGERVFSMPPGVIPRGGDLIIPKEQRDVEIGRASCRE